MASPSRNLAFLLLFILHLIDSQIFAHSSTSSPPITRKRIIILTDPGLEIDEGDYDDGFPPEVVTSQRSPRLSSVNHCQYDPCLENQEPCESLKAKTGCMCPGKSGEDMVPHAPRIQALQPITEGENRGQIVVQWCAPNSAVSTYKVTIEGSEVTIFKENHRRALVRSLEVGTKVCVEAVNSAGTSSPTDFSCKRYERPESSDHKLLAGVIGGGVAFILILLIVAIVLCRRQMCRKAKRESVVGS
ncbi:leucine-rich repeat neuronal protein 4 [Cyprinodon tularosa]|uniref:leucine-rich repeat neuronal protein 4 n=1 Tax=Cyprinodon tularosa TaxID=77115 RepID=UPI0018E2415F|nr:leucine-rich repeat neuronal protein 4 [Cyprinodon tularosa]